MDITADDAADVAYAVQQFPWVHSVFALPPVADVSDSFAFAIVLSPYGINELVETHYALVAATGGRALPGRVLYIDGNAAVVPVVQNRGRRLTLGPLEREAARARVEERKQRAEVASKIQDLHAMELAFRRIAEQAALDTSDAHAVIGTPYRGALAASFGTNPTLEVVADPFPSPRRTRVLVVDEDPITAIRVGKLDDVDVIQVDDAWSAVDRLTKGDVDLAICALSIGGVSGAKIHKLVAAERPEMARRIVFLASEAAVSQAPPSSASGRVVARPITPETVRSLLDALGGDGRRDRRG